MTKIVALMVCVSWATGLAAQHFTRAEYIERYKDIATAHAERYGIPASIKMAQGLLESDSGNSRLATDGNNHFGIKCRTDWTGDTMLHNDDAPDECFRRYSSAEESWIDHSEFLDTGDRYQGLFELDPLDYRAWAVGLKAAGYATDPAYPEKLIRIIEENELYLLDRGERLPMGTIIAREETAAPFLVEVTDSEIIDPDNFKVELAPARGRTKDKKPTKR